MTRRRIPEATVARLPVYQRILEELLRSGTTTVSSELLASSAQVNAAKVRKDLSLLGSFGTRGAGYDAAFLIEQIDRQLGLDRAWPVVIAGIGNLGRALAHSRGFTARNFNVAALLDTDPTIIGQQVEGVVVRHLDDLPVIAAEEHLSIGVITTPASVAQRVADMMASAGVRSISPCARGAVGRPVAVRRPQHRAPGHELLPVPFSGQHRGGPDAGHPVDRSDLGSLRLSPLARAPIRCARRDWRPALWAAKLGLRRHSSGEPAHPALRFRVVVRLHQRFPDRANRGCDRAVTQ
jgi:NADH/NAD ratio-sensing transcriptional regulator Rex